MEVFPRHVRERTRKSCLQAQLLHCHLQFEPKGGPLINLIHQQFQVSQLLIMPFAHVATHALVFGGCTERTECGNVLGCCVGASVRPPSQDPISGASLQAWQAQCSSKDPKDSLPGQFDHSFVSQAFNTLFHRDSGQTREASVAGREDEASSWFGLQTCLQTPTNPPLANLLAMGPN